MPITQMRTGFSDSLGGTSAAAWIVGIILAVIGGLQGTHASMFFYLPILGTEIIRFWGLLKREHRAHFNSVSLWALVLSAIAFFGAKYFNAYMSSGTSRNIRHAPEKFFDEVLPAFKEILGYGRMEWLVIVFVLIAAFGYIFAAKELSAKPELWGIMPIVLGIIVVLISATFTTADVAPRYFIMQVFAVGIGVGVFTNLFLPKRTKWLAVLVIIYGIFSYTAFYDALIKNDNSESSDYMKVAEWMEENGYSYGYSTFDHANTITVMSNNSVKVRGINSFEELEGIKWLTDSTWYPPVKSSEGETCYIMTAYTEDDFKTWLEYNNPLINRREQVGDFIVYVLDRDYTVWVE